MSFTPQSMFTVEAAETALVGWGIGAENGEQYKYTGVNSMVGTLISWGKDNYTTDATKTVGSWYIDNNGYIVWGSNGNHNLPITYAVPKNSSLSKIQLIKAQNGASAVPDLISTANGVSVKIDNLVKAGDGALGAYFTIGANGRNTAAQMAEDWEKAIVAASHYSKSGLLQNKQFGTASSIAEKEFPNDDTWAADYNKTGTTGGFGKQFNGTVGNNTYIYIKLMADWEAPVVNTMATDPGGTQTLPGDSTKYVNRFVEEAKIKTKEDAAEEASVTRARGEGFFEFDLGSNGATNSLQTGTNGSTSAPTYQKPGEEGATKESGPHFSLGTSFSGKNSISNLHNAIEYNQFSAVPSEEPFSFGRLAIPDNCYVIVDLNGHKLDRNLDAVNETIHQNVICPSVFLAGLYSRLEVFDSSASEENPAGDGKIMGALGINGDGIIDGCPPDYVSRAGKPAWNVDAWGNSLKGGGVKLGPRAEFTLHSGTITENSAVYGGAVYGTGNNYIYIYDGVMTGNTACKGGATYLSSDSQMVFNMFGGSISGNGADWRRLTRYIHVKNADQVLEKGIEIPAEWKKDGVGTGFRGFGKDFDKKAWSNVESYAVGTKTGLNVKSGEINSEGGGVCVFKNTYFNMYGGSIAYNYSFEYAGGVNVNNTSFFKMYGGEITNNVVTGEVREITGAKISEKGDGGEVTTSTPKANVGGGGVNMFQDSAGIYLNGPGRITDNHTCTAEFDFNTPFSAEKIAEYLTTNEKELADSNLYLSLTMSDHTQVEFKANEHLYPEIKVQGPLYQDSKHFAQVSITPAAGIEAGGYIMRQFLKNGWEDGVEAQNNKSDGSENPKWLGEAEQGHAKDQIGEDGTTAFNVSKYLSTGATTGYVDGFLFTDGGTSIVEGTDTDEGWYLALGTKDSSNLPVVWEYYDNTIGDNGLPKGWTEAKTTAETGTGFSLVYNGEDRKENIRVRLDRSELVGGTDETRLSRYFYLYYDYYTTYEVQLDGSFKENPTHYYYDDGKGGHANILEITSGHYLDGDQEGEPIKQTEAKYASEKYDRLGYRFTINENIKTLTASGGESVAPFHKEDKFHANPNYATMKIERATLMISQLTLTDIDRYYDGTTDFYVKSDTLSAGEITGYAPQDQTRLLMQFVGIENEYVKGKLQNPNVGTTNVELSIQIEEVGRGEGHTHNNHTEKTFPDECLLLNYKVYDQNSGTTTDAEDKGNIPVTLNVNVKPKPITVTLEKQTYEYGSVPIFGTEWGTHANQANWAETYEKAKGGTTLADLFAPVKAPAFGEEGFDPDALGKDGKLAQVDIESENVDPDHGTVDKKNLALRLDQILRISFISAYADRSQVGTYGGSFSYTNTNYAVTWVLDDQTVSDTPATLTGLIEIAKRKINATVSDAASIYGETQAALSLLPENVKHEGGEGDGIVFGDQLGETLGLTDAVKVPTTNALRVTVDADMRPVDKGNKGYYTIDITNKESINENYELVKVVAGKYTVYPRKIVLKANDYSSVYGDTVAAGMGGYTYDLAETQFGDGLSHTSTVIFESDRTAFDKGITYSYTDELPAHTNKGEYKFNVNFSHAKALEGEEDIGVNYAVSYGAAATHTVEARQVSVVIYSPDGQRSEYGEEHVVQQGTGSGVYWYAQSTANGNPSTVVVLEADREDFVSAISLYISENIDINTPAGTYPIMGKYTPKDGNENYRVDFIGSWEGAAPAGYDDPAYGNPDRRAGTYTITRRNIELNISTSLTSEYGDDLVKFWEGTAYTLSRTGGGNALIGDDTLTLAPELFYLNIPSKDNILGGGDVSFAKTGLKTGNYTVLFNNSAYKSSAAYNEGDNANYELSVENGLYVVEARRLKVEVGVQLPDGHFVLNPTMSYGDTFSYREGSSDKVYPAPKRSAQISRIDAEGHPREDTMGEGFLGSDYEDMLGTYLASTDSITSYAAGLTTSGHLRVGVYTFTTQTNAVSNDYNITWVFGKLTVEARTVNVRITKQEVFYTGGEPNVDNSKWAIADGFSLASGDLTTIVALDKADGADAGKYDISLTCSDPNYNFVIIEDTDKGAFVIKPAVITVQLAGENEIVYDKTSHLVEIEFGGDGLTPVRHLFSTVSPADREGKDVYTFADYTVIVSYSGEFGTTILSSANHANVGAYTLQVILNHTGTFGDGDYKGNYCFKFAEEGGSSYEETLTYDIIKATIGIEDLAPLPYNRKTQEAVWSFVNAVHPGVLPDAANYTVENGNIKYAVKMDGDAQTDKNSRIEDGLPYYKGDYTFTLTLTEEDFRNYQFASTERSIVKDFQITPLEVLSGLSKDTEEYDDETRFHITDKAGRNGALSFVFAASSGETPVAGISYNVSYSYTGWGKDGTEEAEHTLLVKVGGYAHAGLDEREPSTYFVDGVGIDEGRMYEILSHNRAFIDAGTYTIRLSFEYENFLLREPTGTDTASYLEYDYTITPVLLSTSAFGDKEFNNQAQEPEVTASTFTPTSEMTGEKAFELLQKPYNGYTLSYVATEMLSSNNAWCDENGKPFNAGTYTVTITLKGHNFAFSKETSGGYVYEDSTQRFIIEAFDIGTTFSRVGEHGADHAFDGELDGKLITRDHLQVYSYSYTGQEIMPNLIRATIRLTADGDPIVYERDNIGSNFQLGTYIDNIYADAARDDNRMATLTVSGIGNYTGTTNMSFSITPMELTAKVGTGSGVYGETLTFDEATLISYLNDKEPFAGDKMFYQFSLAGTEGKMKGEHVLAGDYALVATCENVNYNVTFTGDWHLDGDEEHNGKCGTYTVARRQIAVVINNQTFEYSGKSSVPALSSTGSDWTATFVLNGSGDAIVAGDALTITLSVKDAPAEWNAGTYTIQGVLVETGDGANYEVASWTEGTLTISAIRITVEIKPQTSEYDGNVPTARQGEDWYRVTAGNAASGDVLSEIIRLSIVNPEKNARQYQLTGESTSDNYIIDFGRGNFYTVTPRKLVVAIKDASSYYGEAEAELNEAYYTVTHNGETENAIVKDDDLHIALTKEAGTDAHTYNITGSWNYDPNYEVTFEGGNSGTMGTYTIQRRPITVKINDQSGVYGSIRRDELSQDQGEEAAWYVVGLSREEDGLTPGLFVVGSDVLGITLRRDEGVAPGDYKITGNASNKNYAVTFTGAWSRDDDADKAGVYHVDKRAVTVTVLAQTGVYGNENPILQGEGSAYTAECTNATSGSAFVAGDSVRLTVSVASKDKVGKSPIVLTIAFGANKDYYDITVQKDGVEQGDGSYQVADAYTLEPRKLRVTITDLTSVYGEEELSLSIGTLFATNTGGSAILEIDDEAVRAAILAHLKIEDEERLNGFLQAGKYAIRGENFTTDDGHYEIAFTGSREDSETGFYTVEKRNISVSIQNAGSTYGDIGDYAGDPAVQAALDKLLAADMTVRATNVGSDTDRTQTTEIGEDKLNIRIYLLDPEVSGSKHLKVKQYIIFGSASEEENIVRNYTVSFLRGTYTVEARQITVTLGTKDPSSEYGDPITPSSEWGWSAALTYGGSGQAVLDGDNIEFTMSTTFVQGNDVGSRDITATEIVRDGNDNGNYNIVFRRGVYRIVPREIEITVKAIAPVVYGTEWKQPEYDSARAGDKEGEPILNGEVSIKIDVQGADYSATHYLRYREGGYSLTASVEGVKQGNYNVKITNISAVKYTVLKRGITINIENAESVYGEDFLEGGMLRWTVTDGEIVKNEEERTSDDLQITITKESGRNVGDYALSGECRNPDYEVTFTGAWDKEGDDAHSGVCGIYTITRRTVKLDTIDQAHAIYGENDIVNGARLNTTVRYAADGTPFELAAGDEIASVVRLYIVVNGEKWNGSDRLDATSVGGYSIRVEGINANYIIELGNSGVFRVAPREIRIRIADQYGVYGEANEVNQEQYSPENVNGTGKVIVDGDSFRFSFTSAASEPKQNVGSYPITGSAEATGETKADNYIITYVGSDGTAGTYTLSKRTIVVAITDQTAVYGGSGEHIQLLPTLDVLYTATYNGVAENAILEGDAEKLSIRLKLIYDAAKDFSTAGALKVGSYAIVGSYGVDNSHANYDVSFAGSWAAGDENHSKAGTLRVDPRGITVALGMDGAVFSYYGDAPKGPWSEANTNMYAITLTSGTGPAIVTDAAADVIKFTMRTLATKESPVGQYPLIGEAANEADNANYTISFTGGFSSSDDVYSSYSGLAGVYNVSPRQITVKIKEYTREYGEEVVNSEVLSELLPDGSNGKYYTLPADWSVNGYTAEKLGIVLNCVATESSGAQTYTITGSEDDPNYEVIFEDGEGKYVITQRTVYVVILPQVSVYGKPIVIDEQQNYWYAFRGNARATWAGSSTYDPYHVLARGDTLNDLKVRLTKRGAVDGYEFNEGNGIYGGQYAIEGSYSNSNYHVIFVGAHTEGIFTEADFKDATFRGYEYLIFTAEDTYDYEKDPDGLLKKEYGESGVYTIAPRSVTITLRSVDGTYGGKEHTRYNDPLKKGVELDAAQGVVWDYNYDSEEIDAGHVSYLSFYIGGKYATDLASEKYLTVASYPIVAYWGLGLEKSRMRDWNYSIVFRGEWRDTVGDDWKDDNGDLPESGHAGKYTVSEATIEQSTTWLEVREYLVEYDAQPYTMSVNKSMTDTSTGKRYLTFKGDIKEASRIEFGDLYHNPKANSKLGIMPQSKGSYPADETTGAPKVKDVGYWIVEVVVKAQYHRDATFELVYHITPDIIEITLEDDVEYKFTYGTYFYDAKESDPKSFSALEAALKGWLLGEDAYGGEKPVVASLREGGAPVEAGNVAARLNDLLLEPEVVVSIHKMASNKSSGGYLNASRYLITITGGANIGLTFAQDYEVIVCEPKTVTATWEISDLSYRTERYKDAELFIVTYDGTTHTLTPTVTGVFSGDVTTVFAAASYLYETEGGSDGAAAAPLGYGYYVCRVTSRALGGADGGNYAVAEDQHAYISVEKRAITVNIKDRAAHTYGDREESFNDDDWDVDGSTPLAYGDTRYMLGVTLSRTAGTGVDKYKVKGTFTNPNYDVTFVGSWKADGDPDSDHCGTFTIEARPITVFLRDKSVVYGTAIPEDGDIASDITLWHATYDNNVAGIAIVQGDDIRLTMKISYRGANADQSKTDLTVTGYLKAKIYTVVADWDNANYSVTFKSEARPSETHSQYEVERRALRVSLFDAATTEYGYSRPTETHAFTGFTEGDEAYFNEHPDLLFIRFYFSTAAGAELAPGAAYDAVGTYAVRGAITRTDDYIGSNYDVNFVGSWDDNTYPDLVQHAGVYRVIPRNISILIGSVESEYGEIAFIPITLQTGSPDLVGTDTVEDLHITYQTEAYVGDHTNVPGVYPIAFDRIGNPNYRVNGAVSMGATYTVKPRKIMIVVDDQSGEYGDEHTLNSVKDVAWHSYWVTAEGTLREGPGVVYDDDAMRNLRVRCSGLTAASPVGAYALSADYDDPDGCYEIKAEEYGNYNVQPRRIEVTVNDFTNEYGEDHATYFRDGINASGVGFTVVRADGAAGKAIAFASDPISKMHLALDVTRASHRGEYPITCVYEDPNYSVVVKGSYRDGDVVGGTYRIDPRKITVVLVNQSGEYGDDHTPVNRYGITWSAQRPIGEAIVGSDDLGLILSTSANERSVVDTYTLTATWTNTDYDVNVITANYTVTPRRLTASVYGESEYGDDLQETELVLTRTTAGLDGPGIVPGDDEFLTIEATHEAYKGAPVGRYPVTYTIKGDFNADRNYEIVDGGKGEYVILPRKIVVDIDSITQTYGDAAVPADEISFTVSRANGKSGDAILNGEIDVVLNILGFSRNAGEYIIDMQAVENDNYDVAVHTGMYTIEQKEITVHIDDKSSEYGSATEALTAGEIEGLVEGDDLGLSLRVEWGDDLAWHNVGDYAIVGGYENRNYLVEFDGSWNEGDTVGGKYTVYKAENLWLKEYSGDGTVVQGNGLGEGEAPQAKFGEAVIRYYYDEACTQEIEGDLSELGVGVYWAKATVADTLNYGKAETVFAVEVLSSFIYPNGALDVSLFVSIFASQFVIGICALLFVRRRKNKKNQ